MQMDTLTDRHTDIDFRHADRESTEFATLSGAKKT